jgi:uncharacterized protein (TIGR00725 family)
MPAASDELGISTADGQLVRPGFRFDPRRLAWITDAGRVEQFERITPIAAARHVLSQKGALRLPVGVIGPRDANPAEYERAYQMGLTLQQSGFPVICGGRSGAMEAVCRGVSDAGGQAIGILPDGDWHTANAFVAIPIASGIGEARNAVIASASFALVAVGGGYGTLSEMALGLRLGRLVIAMPEALDVPGAVRCASVDAAAERIARRYLALDSGA